MYLVLICSICCVQTIIECRQISLNSNESNKTTNPPINNAILQKPHSINAINLVSEYDGSHSSLYKPLNLSNQSKTVRYKPKRNSPADDGNILMKGVKENSNLLEEIAKLKDLMKLLKDQQVVLDTINDGVVDVEDEAIEPGYKYEEQEKELIQLKSDVKSLKELLVKAVNSSKFAEKEKETKFQKELNAQKEEIGQLKSLVLKLVNKKKPQSTIDHVPTVRSNNKVINQLQELEKHLEKILADNNSLGGNENAILGSPIQRLFSKKPIQQSVIQNISKAPAKITTQPHNRIRTASINDEQNQFHLRPVMNLKSTNRASKTKTPVQEARFNNHSAMKEEISNPRTSSKDIDSLMDLLDRTESKSTSVELDENTALLNELQKLSKANKKDDINVKLKKLQKQIRHLQELDVAKSKLLDDDDTSDQIKKIKLQLKLLQAKENKNVHDDEDDLESNLKSLEKAIDSLRPKDDDFDLDLDLEEKVVSNNDQRFQLLINKLFSKNKHVQVSNQPSTNQQIALLIKRLTATNRPVESEDQCTDQQTHKDNYEDNSGADNSDGGGSYGAGGHSISSYSGSGHTNPSGSYSYGPGGSFYGVAASGGGVSESYGDGMYSGGSYGGVTGYNGRGGLYDKPPRLYDTGYGANLYGTGAGYVPGGINVLYGAPGNGISYGGVNYRPEVGMYTQYPYGQEEYRGGNKYNPVQLYGDHFNAYSKKPTAPTYSSKVNKRPMPSYNPYSGYFEDGSLYGKNPSAGMYPNKNAFTNYANSGKGNAYAAGTSTGIISGGNKYDTNESSTNNNQAGGSNQPNYSEDTAENNYGVVETDYKKIDESSSGNNHPFPAYQGAADDGPGNTANYENPTATSAANNQQSYENPAANKQSYTRQKVSDLQSEIYDLQNVINGFNRPEYTIKPDEQETVYKLNKQIADLKNVMSKMNNENSNADYVQVDIQQENPKILPENGYILPDINQSNPRRQSLRSNRQIKNDHHGEESKEADEMLEGITSFIDNILHKDEEKTNLQNLRIPEEESQTHSNNPELEHVKQKLKDLRKKLGMGLQQKLSNPLEKSAYQPSYGYHQDYEEESGENEADRERGKGDKKEGKKLDIFDKVFTKILDKLIDKAGIAIPKLIEAFFGFGKESISEYYHGGKYTDNYKGGNNNYGDLEKTFRGFGLIGYLPMIIIKLMTNLGTFVNYLRKFKFLRSFMVPALVVVLVGGLLIFLIWFLQPGDEQNESIGYENYGGKNPYGYSDTYNQQGGYYGGGGAGYRSNEFSRTTANDNIALYNNNNLRDNTNAVSKQNILPNQYKNIIEHNDGNHNSNPRTFYTDYNNYKSLYPDNYNKR